MRRRCVYLDNNANSLPNRDTLETLMRWSLKGNPSGIYPAAEDARELIALFSHDIASQLGFSMEDFIVLFTSGASESNTTILSTCCRAFIKRKGIQPHVIVSSVEHDSIMEWKKEMEEERIAVDELEVGVTNTFFSRVDPAALRSAMRPNTCLVSVMGSNNETGAINDIKTLASIAHARGVPFHTDAVQLAPREIFDVEEMGIDAFSLSFHKIGGPVGCGMLAIRKSLRDGYGLRAHICGTQQGGMRGGTIPIASIAASRSAFIHHYTNRPMKNAFLKGLKRRAIEALASLFPIFYLMDYRSASMEGRVPDPSIVLISSPTEESMINTLFFAVYSKGICNVKIRKELAARCILVSIGSACKTGSKIASHILSALRLPRELYPGVLRVSLGDSNTEEDVELFARELRELVISPLCKKDDSS